jgi:hypothetical protein
MVLPDILHGLLRASSGESGRERTATWIRSISGRRGSGRRRGGRERQWGVGSPGRLGLGDFWEVGSIFGRWDSRGREGAERERKEKDGLAVVEVGKARRVDL